MRDGERPEVVSLPRGDEAVWGTWCPLRASRLRVKPVLSLGFRETNAPRLSSPSRWFQNHVINMRYVNKHLAKNVFKLEGLADLVDIAEKSDHSVFYDLNFGYYYVGLHPVTRRFVGIKFEGVYCMYTCLPFELSTSHWVFSKVMREIVMFWKERKKDGYNTRVKRAARSMY